MLAVVSAVASLSAWVPSVSAQSPPTSSSRTDVWDVYALEYAVLPGFPVRGLVEGADSTRRIDISMMVWLLRGDGRNVLVDAGFHSDSLVQRWAPRDFVRPSDALARLSVAPEDVTDVVITHLHWDHAGGVDLFPNARVWIQREELEFYTAEGRPGRAGVTVEDVALLERLRREGRLELVEGDGREILPGVTVYTGGRHTHASQYVGVRTEAGTVVLASDNLYLYENLERRVPIAQTLDRESNLRAQARMLSLAASPRLIVPGHDPLVFSRFPEPGHGVARIR